MGKPEKKIKIIIEVKKMTLSLEELALLERASSNFTVEMENITKEHIKWKLSKVDTGGLFTLTFD